MINFIYYSANLSKIGFNDDATGQDIMLLKTILKFTGDCYFDKNILYLYKPSYHKNGFIFIK